MSIPRAHHGAALIAVALGASAFIVTGCASERPTGEAIRGLVILSGDVGKARLTVHATSDGSPRQVDLADPATAWISGAPSGAVVATLADGRLAVRDVDGDPANRWTIVPSDAENGADTKFFGVASPDGKRAAALTLGSAGQFGVAITDLAKGTTITFPLDGEPLLTTPAWLDDNRIGIVAVDTTAGGAVAVASVSTGDLTGGPANVRAIAMSGDGTVAAWVSSTDGRLYASNSRSWLLGEEAGTIAIEGTAGTVPGAFALDATGGRLAVAWEHDDGQVVEITVHRRTSQGWTTSQRLSVPENDPRAVVSWLR
jgi:hypothetical protein